MSQPLQRFHGKVALVTGASRGIGLAAARRFLTEGASVCITARRPAGLEAARDELIALSAPDRVIISAGAADDPDHQQAAVAATMHAFGRLDVLVNNTGINPSFGPLLDLDPGVARKMFEVNVLAALFWVKQAHAAWMGAHGGAIVNVSSVAGLGVSPNLAFYGITKAALISMTKQLAVELAPDIRVNAVAPAVIRTRFAEALYADDEAAVAASYALKRIGEPDDVAGAIAYFASTDSGWTTGQTLVIDGGMLGSRG
jgi:3-oxoacyl-[acyl-carrier protein] reductase